MKATLINLKWDYNKSEGEIKTLTTFNGSDSIIQLDFLSDCIYELQQLHDQLFQREVEISGTSHVLEVLGITKQLTDKESKA